MKRLTEAWFEFKGRRSDDFGAFLLAMPTREQPALRGKAHEVAGRSGSVFLTDGAFDDVHVTVKFVAEDADRLNALHGWLGGTGKLRFSDRPNEVYDARIVRAYKHQPFAPRLDGQSYTVTFECSPLKWVYPDPAPITVTASGTRIENPGTAAAAPRVKITGAGDFSVTIGLETVFFMGVTDGIIVDSLTMDAYTADGAALANDHMSGEPFAIRPGTNIVSWELHEGGRVDSVEILPRWRLL